jgi:hypothetical protein
MPRLSTISFKPTAAIALAALWLTGCNAGAIALGVIAQRVLGPTTASGTVANPPANTKIGYLAWIELLNDGQVKGQLNFDLVANKTVQFDKSVSPESGGKFSIEVTPQADVAEGTYVVFAWEDANNNGAFDGEAGEKRAPEVYRVRGQAANRGLWTTEKFVFTEKKLAIEYASQDGGLTFTF